MERFKGVKKFFIPLFMILLSVEGAGAAIDSFSNIGLAGYQVQALVAASNGEVYAATSNGVFRYTGVGGWVAMNTGITFGDVRSLIKDPNDDRILYAGTCGQGVLKNVNYGRWEEINQGLPSLCVNDLVVDPNSSNIIYACIEDYGVYKTKNGGGSWQQVNNGLPNPSRYDVRSLAYDKENGILYAGTSGAGIFKSADGGASYKESNGEYVPTLPTEFPITSLVVNPYNPEIIYAGLYGGGVYQSRDAGKTWENINIGVEGTELTNKLVQRLMIDLTNPEVLYVGTNGNGNTKGLFRRYSDQCAGPCQYRWEVMPGIPPAANIMGLAMDPFTTSKIYAGAASYEGVYEFTKSKVPPGVIFDLGAINPTKNTITLGWTAPGEDGYYGTAKGYDIRYATEKITNANWDFASQASGEPAPAQAGTPQTFVVTGLSEDILYYFAIKTRDKDGLWSSLSNIACCKTTDVTPPAGITDLMGESPDRFTANLNWTAPGDNGDGLTDGKPASSYDIRYGLTSQIVESWAGATKVVDNIPTPAAPGTTEHLVVTGLAEDTDHYFGIKTYDEAGNASGLSNIRRVHTKDVTPPGKINDLKVERVPEKNGQLKLIWTTPGDNGSLGNLSEGNTYDGAGKPYYILKYYTNDSFSGWETASVYSYPLPDPKAKGSLQEFTAVGLDPYKKYTFCLWTVDEAGNVSELSNVVSERPDVKAPGKIIDLTAKNPRRAAVDSYNCLVDLEWTSPGDDGYTEGGAADHYLIRYADFEILTEGDWQAAFEVENSIVPKAPTGTPNENFTVSGLSPDVLYYFAVRAVDKAGNASSVSNSPSAKTPDIIPPAKVTDLTINKVEENAVTLEWTAPGDNDSRGQAEEYDIRYAGSEIKNGSDFDNATRAPEPPPTPQPAGTKQTFRVTGLYGDRIYYFALKTKDKAGNWSGLSNSPFASTDVLGPDPVTDLDVSCGLNFAELTWTAPGENQGDWDGKGVTSYDIRYSKYPINESNFESATKWPNPPSPLPKGQEQSIVITGLARDTLYYFALKSKDDALPTPHISKISNPASCKTLDNVAPRPINDLRIVGFTGDEVTLTWTAPGDNDDQGQASSYDIRYCENTFINWNSAKPVENSEDIKAPLPAGATEQFKVKCLHPDTLYYFAIKTADDEVPPNVSDMSNLTFCKTRDDTPPGTAREFTATALDELCGENLTNVLLTWRAPGDNGYDKNLDKDIAYGNPPYYEIAWSKEEITPNNWKNLTKKYKYSPKPVDGQEEYKVTCLEPDTLYWFGLKTYDEAGNPSALAIDSEWTKDIEPPAQITDLRAKSLGPDEVTLTWTAVGDNGQVGTADRYDLRYSTQPITSSNWSSATKATGLPKPQASGKTEIFTVPGLTENIYYFALKVIDEAGNESPLSNILGPVDPPNRPQVTIDYPDSGQILKGTETIKWRVFDPDGNPVVMTVEGSLSGVESWFLIAGGLRGSPPYPNEYTCNWDTLFISDGNYRVKVSATDSTGLTGDTTSGGFIINNYPDPPQISILYPKGGEILNGVIMIDWQASDPDPGQTSKLKILVEYSPTGGHDDWHVVARDIPNTPPYNWNTVELEDGNNYLVRLTATDPDGKSSSATSGRFTIDNPHKPTVKLLSPTGGEVWSGIQEIKWKAEDPDGDPVTIDLAYAYSETGIDQWSGWSDYKPMASNLSNTGKYSFNTASLLEGNGWYKIKITAKDGGEKAEDNSGDFRILNLPSIECWPIDGIEEIEIILGDETTIVIPVCALPLDLRPGCLNIFSWEGITNDLFAEFWGIINEANKKIDGDPDPDPSLDVVPGTIRHFKLKDKNGNPVCIQDPSCLVKIGIPYQNGGLENTTLRIYRLNEEEEAWEPLKEFEKTWVDRENHLVWAEVSCLNFDGTGVNDGGTYVILNSPLPSNLDDVVAYPNPLEIEEAVDGQMKFINLTQGSKVKIFTLSGDLVRELKDPEILPYGQGNYYGLLWDGTNEDGKRVASGVYFAVVKDDDHKKIIKISVLK